jgi:hypothetical protein
MEFYLATVKNELLLFAGKWMELKNIILSEVSQVQKAKSLLSYVKYRPNTNTAILRKKQVTLRGRHIQDRVGKRRKLRR